MKISFALVITATLLLFQIPARAGTIYPSQQWCRVYDDTSFIQIPGQCGTVVALLPTKTVCSIFRERRRIRYYYYPNYYCPY
jgi:hypothetical protein